MADEGELTEFSEFKFGGENWEGVHNDLEILKTGDLEEEKK